ncbi:MAG: SDR family NAD(P)-dependent oxidoreductase, partial [Saprospiraceae bacterium]|nr:SDR family NAD(P)-dependent oxidoreductase [Saprospiraceae bacterium]
MNTFDINKLPTQKGRVAIITGSNIGLGYESALALAQKEMKIILACRNTEKANKAKNNILKLAPKADLEVIQLDLSNLQSVRDFAQNYQKKYTRLDILMNNAGVMVPPYTATKDGFELQFGVNHLGHFLLTKLLLPTMLDTPNSRVVSLSSNAHKQGKINFNDLQSQKDYSPMRAYCQS